jgi:hypothetical protein
MDLRDALHGLRGKPPDVVGVCAAIGVPAPPAEMLDALEEAWGRAVDLMGRRECDEAGLLTLAILMTGIREKVEAVGEKRNDVDTMVTLAEVGTTLFSMGTVVTVATFQSPRHLVRALEAERVFRDLSHALLGVLVGVTVAHGVHASIEDIGARVREQVVAFRTMGKGGTD